MASLKEMSVTHIRECSAHSGPCALTHGDKPTIQRHLGFEATGKSAGKQGPGVQTLLLALGVRPHPCQYLL